MIQSNYFTTNKDLINHFTKFINWEEIILAYEDNFHDANEYLSKKIEVLANAPSTLDEAREYYYSVLESTGDITGNYVSQFVKEMDKKGASFKEGKVHIPDEMIQCVNKAKEAGIQPYGFMRKYGGLGVPFIIRAFMGELLYRVDTSFAIALGCVNLGEILERIASEEMKQEWLPRMAAGEFCAAMGLTEPNHGSDLPNITTKATKDSNGKWVLNGTKRFITQACGLGETPSIILTLARSGGSGARGLSFFLVQSKDCTIAGIEKKLGLHASPTCEVVFENTPALLIGEEGLGLVKYTMGMLNGARMGIAAQGVGMAVAAFEEAKIFSETRIQFSKPIQEIPAVKRLLDKMEREVYAMRCLTLEGGRAVDLYYWRMEHLKRKGLTDKEVSNDELVRQYMKLADVLTPMSKFYCAEYSNKVVYDALQIHGGSGFTEDYDISRIYRDARITSIYDGTSQIQVMAAIGGIITGLTEKGQLTKYFDSELESFNPSELVLKNLENLKEIVFLFKSFTDSKQKESFSVDIVEQTARVLAGIQLEKTSAKLEGEEKTHRLNHSLDYNVDTFASLKANQERLNFYLKNS